LRNYYTKPKFDECQFADMGIQPVSVRYMGLDRWDTPGLGFGDFASMHRQSKVQFHGRDINAPSFALNVPEMKLLLARYFERRAGWRIPKVGTPEWRLKQALRKIKKDIPAKRKLLHKLNEQYITLQRQGAAPKAIRELENNVRTLDGEILMAQRGLAPVVALIYFHFRLGFNSPQTAAELGIRPQAVRQTAYRLTHLWEKMQSGQDHPPSKKEIKNEQVREHRKNFTPEQREAFKKYHVDYRKANHTTLLASGQRWRNANRELVRKQAREATARRLKKKKAEGEAQNPRRNRALNF